jgi:hypothetical protein
MAEAYASTYLFRCKEAGIRWTSLYELRYRPGLVSVLLDLDAGKRRQEARGVKVPYQGQMVELRIAIQERGILVSDADALLKASRDRQESESSSCTEPDTKTEPAAEPDPGPGPAGGETNTGPAALAAQLERTEGRRAPTRPSQ